MSDAARCRGVTKAGSRCRNRAQEGDTFCVRHTEASTPTFEIVPEETAVMVPAEPGVWKCPHCATQYPEGTPGTTLELRKKNHLRRTHGITVE